MRIWGGRLVRRAGVLLSLALVAQSPSAAARHGSAFGLAAALGPEVAIGEPSGGYVGRLTVAREHGPAGTPLTVTTEGLPAGEEFQLVWRTVDDAWKVTDAEYHGREYRRSPPRSPRRSDRTVEISPEGGPVGTPTTVEIKGIRWRSLVNSWDLLYDINFTGWELADDFVGLRVAIAAERTGDTGYTASRVGAIGAE